MSLYVQPNNIMNVTSWRRGVSMQRGPSGIPGKDQGERRSKDRGLLRCVAQTSHRTKLSEYLKDELTNDAVVHGLLSHATLYLTATA